MNKYSLNIIIYKYLWIYRKEKLAFLSFDSISQKNLKKFRILKI